MNLPRPLYALSLAACLFIGVAPASAIPVTMNGLVAPSCVLTLSSGGVLGVSTDGGRLLGSEEVGGSPAVLSILATGVTPTITVGSPTMSIKPGAYAGSPTVSVRYSSTGGANQSYTSASSTFASGNLLSDTLTIHMKAADTNGFVAGNYQLQTNVTCQQ